MRGYPQIGYRGARRAAGSLGFQELPAMSAALHGARAAWLLARYGSFVGSAIGTSLLLYEGYNWYTSTEKKTIQELLTQLWTGTHLGPCTIPNWSVPHHCIGGGQLTPCGTTSASFCNNPVVNSASALGNHNPVSGSVIVHESWSRVAGDPTWEDVQKRVNRVTAVPYVTTETITKRKDWRRPWYVEETGWTWGLPVTTAGNHDLIRHPPRVITVDNPPPPKTDEIKVRVNQILAPLRAIINASSEAADAVDALFNALPACYRKAIGSQFGPQRKLRATVRYLHRIANDPGMSIAESCGQPNSSDRDTRNAVQQFVLHALKNLIIEGLIDAANGIPGGWVANMSQQLGIPFGLQTILKVIRAGTLSGVT